MLKFTSPNSKYDEQKAIEYINRDLPMNVDMLQSLQLGRGKILEVRNDGLLMQDKISGTYMIAADNEAFQREMIESIDEAEVIATHQPYMKDEIFKKYDFKKILPCYTASYLSDERMEVKPEGEIIQLGAEHIETVFEKYHLMNNHDYIVERIGAGVMYGYYIDGDMAAFVGIQEEGGIGFLEVFDEYKRRGIGTVLEAHMINVMLDNGLTPFAHVETDNIRSLGLQKKLGLQLTDKPVYWFFAPQWC